jgi:hypothetical protein
LEALVTAGIEPAIRCIVSTELQVDAARQTEELRMMRWRREREREGRMRRIRR